MGGSIGHSGKTTQTEIALRLSPARNAFPSQKKKREEAQMRYKPNSVAALHIALGSFSDTMRVEQTRTPVCQRRRVGELRNLTAWPENVAITTPDARYP